METTEGNMKATFNIKVGIVDRTLTLLTDTEEMKNVPTALAIALLRIFEGCRPRVKKELDNFFTKASDETETQEQQPETEQTGQEQEKDQADAPEA